MATLRINPRIVAAEYAVRGRLAQRAAELRASGVKTIECNIGNPQALGQKPMTYVRQLVALAEYPEMNVEGVPGDIVERGKAWSEVMRSTGAYSDSIGHAFVRKSVGDFIEKRDGEGVTVSEDDIMLTNGASAGIQMVLTMLNVGDNKVMIPVPQYPLYSATLTCLGTPPVPYFLDPSKGWAPDVAALEDALRADDTISALVVINPGNPTGQLMSRDEIRDMLSLAEKYNVAILADEVYQENVFEGEFTSFTKVHSELGFDVPLFSFHSTSKGLIGECGKRGGYLHCQGVDPTFASELKKYQSIQLCSNVLGQLATEAMVNTPSAERGDESHPFFQKYDALAASMRERASIMMGAFDEMKGVTCLPPVGAMYLYPRIFRSGL